MRPNFQGSMSPTPPRRFSAPVVPQDRPVYRILEGKGCFLDDIMFFPGDIVIWDEEPNKDMEPLNDMARVMSDDFFDKCQRLGELKAAGNGMRYIPLRRPTQEDRELNSVESRRVEIIKGDGGVPVMGARKRGKPKAERVDNSDAEAMPIADTKAGKRDN